MRILEDLVSQIEKWPVSVAMVIALSFMGIALKRMEAFKNKYIPGVLMVLGIVLYALIGEPSSINPDVRYPLVRLGMYGLILGMISWLAQGLIWKFMIEKLPGLKGDTELLKKPLD